MGNSSPGDCHLFVVQEQSFGGHKDDREAQTVTVTEAADFTQHAVETLVPRDVRFLSCGSEYVEKQ
jgi:hypothetical protein